MSDIQLPKPARQGPWPGDPALYSEAQMRAMYQQGYAAALSQTAGVPEPTLEMLNAGWRELERQGVDPESVEMRAVYDAMVRAAPAASGGEDGWSLAMRVREALDRASCPDHFMRIAVETITGDAPQPPTGASVSERAREILSLHASINVDRVTTVQALAALEQALTQQRGEDVAPGDGHAWGDFSRKDLCELADRLTEDANLRVTRKWPFLKSPGAIANAIDSATRHYPLVGAIRNVLIETDQIYIVPDTTPQPSADAVREANNG